MPAPLVPVLIGLGVALITTTAYVKWDEIKAALQGREIAVLGPRKAGKTTLIKFLKTGKVDRSYRETTAESFGVTNESFSYKGDLDSGSIPVVLKEGMDVAGAKGFYPRWKKLAQSADLILYLFQADRVLEGDEEHRRRIREDAGQLKNWLAGHPGSPDVYLVATHCDKHEDFKLVERESANEYVLDGFSDDPVVKELHRKTTSNPVVLGSLKTEEDARGLVTQIFAHLLS